MIEIVRGDATAPSTPGQKVIAHICNDGGGWGAGFVLALSKRWPEPEAEYRRWAAGGAKAGFRLGEVQMVQVKTDTWVANMVAQVRRSESGPPIRYGALAECLGRVAAHVRENCDIASVHIPRIGCGLAGGSWDEVGPIVDRELRGLRVVVYDWP